MGCGTAAFGEPFAIRGAVADRTGGAIGNASIRLLHETTRVTLQRGRTSERGDFEFEGLPPGRYWIAVSGTGWRERLLMVESMQPDADRLQIRLELIGCDAPGSICDYYYAGPGPHTEPEPIDASRRVSLRAGGTADLDRSDAVQNARGADVALRSVGGRLYLEPLNKTRLAHIGGTEADCDDARFDVQPVRMDGLGPGSVVCAVTGRGGRSQLFITREVSAVAEEVDFHFVSRKRKR